MGCGTFCRAWIAGTTGMIFAHELGHNLNLAHAGTDPENDSTINNVYGDYSDPMGSSGSNWYLFNAAHGPNGLVCQYFRRHIDSNVKRHL
ncbi:MAG: hypothetical protein IPH22_07755 [Nitrosomonas sp.]|nr:hypothetical protein [Nitrosomonas sp.]